MNTPSIFFQMLTVAVFFASCQENIPEISNNESIDEQIILDENVMISELDEVYRISDEAIFRASTEEGMENSPTYCASLSHNKGNKLIILDFGNNGCTDQMGKLRKGSLHIEYTGEPGSLLSGRTIRFENYSVNGKKVEGTISTSDFTRNKNGIIEFIRSHKDIQITFPEEEAAFSTNSTYLIKWVSGEGDIDFFNNVYELSGTASGVSRKGIAFSTQIVHPIQLQTNCFSDSGYYPVKGSSQISPENGRNFRVDFGDGECDKTTTIKIGDKIINIELP